MREIRTIEDVQEVSAEMTKEIRDACNTVLFFAKLTKARTDGGTGRLPQVPRKVIDNLIKVLNKWDSITTKEVHAMTNQINKNKWLWTSLRNPNTDLTPLIDYAYRILHQPYYYPFYEADKRNAS